MKIVDVKSYLISPTGVFVKIETDEGITGYGEATILYFPQSVAAMIQDMKGYLIGEDPQRIEYIWQSLFRDMFMRGGPVHSAAMSGIDMALWDIKGKYLNVPVYQLLGGLVRDRVRLYGHVAGRSAEEIAKKAKKLADTGVNMIRFRGFHDYDAQSLHDHALGVKQQLEYLEAIRAAVGDEVDIIVECHGRYDPEWAIKLAKGAEKFNPFFIEDPIRHENPQAMALVRSHTTLPLAIGERAHNKWDFRELIVNNYVDYIRPDICHCGGITEMKKIAALAETFYINLVPHNTQGPLAYAATMHAAFAISNVAVVEAAFVNPENRMTDRFVKSFPEFENGYALPPKGPGLGIEVNEEEIIAATENFKPPINMRLRGLDGSVMDW
jgi:galactonate dehydratase